MNSRNCESELSLKNQSNQNLNRHQSSGHIKSTIKIKYKIKIIENTKISRLIKLNRIHWAIEKYRAGLIRTYTSETDLDAEWDEHYETGELIDQVRDEGERLVNFETLRIIKKTETLI